ncbi:hypothetical protein JQ600_35535 [Bradyrhizobium sp. AUGA SZCCT0176]|uniref:hypothetical protein n=1 Tax=Bradyrhizobium sp. AUGA SZCCT0176 TaxID=2807664 RepID=UPI001BA5E1A8|nr:hypothetical protein [Bradyrhizobium sp. AUGA SZCCT0176]MBR1230210.1 hypothetical protein [Bradyrhizobium sp. AUGA SZCCT0176]
MTGLLGANVRNFLPFSENFSGWSGFQGGTGVNALFPDGPTLSVASQQQVPDATGGAVGEGFTCTGLAHDPVNNTWWVGNYGQKTATDGSSPFTSLCQVSLDGTTLVSQFAVTPNTGMQGVAYVTPLDCVAWCGAATGLVYFVDRVGNQARAPLSVPYTTPNGLTWDDALQGLWVSDNATGASICISLSGIILRSFDWTGQGGPIDHFHVDAARGTAGYLWASSGANGAAAVLIAFDKAKDRIVNQWRLDTAQAVEGLHVSGTTVTIVNDGYYHSTGSPATSAPYDVNNMQTYTLPGSLPAYRYRRVFAAYTIGPFGRMVGRIIADKGGGATSSDFTGWQRASDIPAGMATYSHYMRSTDGVTAYNVGMRLLNGTQVNKVVTGAWTRFSETQTVAANATAQAPVLRGTFGSDDFIDILITGAMLNAGPIAAPYVPRLGA